MAHASHFGSNLRVSSALFGFSKRMSAIAYASLILLLIFMRTGCLICLQRTLPLTKIGPPVLD